MLQVKIQLDPLGDTLNVWIFEKDKLSYTMRVAKRVDFVMEEIKEGVQAEPTMKISGMLAQEFMQAFAEELDRHNIKTENDNHISGKLVAQEKHLQDMRKLVFNKK